MTAMQIYRKGMRLCVVFYVARSPKGANSGYILKVVTSMISREDASNPAENFVCLKITYN